MHGSCRTLRTLLFTGVTNAAAIRALIMAKTLDVAFMEASHIASPFTVLVAANKALHIQATQPALRAASLHAELLLCLHAGRNVVDALRGLGASAASTNILFAVFDATDADIEKLCGLVECGPRPAAAGAASDGTSAAAGAAVAGDTVVPPSAPPSPPPGLTPLEAFYPRRIDVGWLCKHYTIAAPELMLPVPVGGVGSSGAAAATVSGVSSPAAVAASGGAGTSKAARAAAAAAAAAADASAIASAFAADPEAVGAALADAVVGRIAIQEFVPGGSA